MGEVCRRVGSEEQIRLQEKQRYVWTIIDPPHPPAYTPPPPLRSASARLIQLLKLFSSREICRSLHQSEEEHDKE